MSHQSKDNRKIKINHRLNQLKERVRNLLTSEEGIKYRSKRPNEVKSAFGQLKSNNKFNKFTFRGLEKVEMEFLLMAIGHNFRKIAVKGVISSKVAKRCSKIVLKIEINVFANQEYFSSKFSIA